MNSRIVFNLQRTFVFVVCVYVMTDFSFGYPTPAKESNDLEEYDDISSNVKIANNDLILRSPTGMCIILFYTNTFFRL